MGTDVADERHRVRVDVELAVRVWPAAPDRPRQSDVLCVHGLASNARMWDGVAGVMASRGHRVVAVDQRGHGRSDKPDDGYDFATLVDDLVALIDALGLERPLVAGQSWGANVVVELAHQQPAAVRGLVCVDGGFIELGRRFADWEQCVDKMAPPRLAGTPLADIERYFRHANRDWPETGIQGALANFEVRADGTIAPWLTFERHLQILRHLFEHRPSQRFPQIKVPVLLAPADAPAAWSDKRSAVEEAAALLPRARVRWFSPAHHDIHAQQPEALADVIDDALQEGFFG